MLPVRPAIQPAYLTLTVGQLGAEQLLERVTVGYHRDRGRSNIEADELIPVRVPREWSAIQNKLGTEGPPTADVNPGDPAAKQPPCCHVHRCPPMAWVGLVQAHW